MIGRGLEASKLGLNPSLLAGAVSPRGHVKLEELLHVFALADELELRGFELLLGVVRE